MSTLIFAAVALFFVWKLRSVLGEKTGQEGRRVEPARDERAEKPGVAPGDAGNVIRLPGAAVNGAAESETADRWSGVAERGTKLLASLEAIAARDANFVAKPFLDGARSAYEMIVTAFAAGDRKTLKTLLATDVYDSFTQAIAQRETREEKMTTTFVSVDKPRITDAQLKGTIAQVSVRFLSKLVNVVTDKAGQPIDDLQGKVIDSGDVWTFSRDVTARDPNWRLVATESDQGRGKAV